MEGSYKINDFAKTAEEPKAGTIINPGSLEEDKKLKKNEIGPPLKLEKGFPGFRKNLYEYLVEYSNYTTIQGLRYVGEQSRSIIERLAWLLFFCISLYFCINLIIQSYTKWDTSPVLVSFATRPTPLWKIPFPAITICPQTKTRQTVYNFTQNFQRIYYGGLGGTKNITEEELKHFADLVMVCENDLYPIGNLTAGYDSIEFLMKTAPRFDPMFWICKYPLSNETCHDLFTPILTEEGICYTFNILNRTEVFRDNVFQFGDFMSHERESGRWTVGAGYKKNALIDTYPRRAIGAGYEWRFNIALRSYEQDMDYVCKGPIQGFKIILHNPAETPKFGLNYFHAPLMQVMMVALKPDMITTSEGLRNYDPHRRQCYFPEERQLAFYRSYTQTNCDVECLTNYTRTKCGCVAFHMPHEEGTPICGSGSKACMTNAKNELLRMEIKSIIDKEESDSKGYSECDCLPGCTSLLYDAETSQADLNVEKVLSGFGFDPNSIEFRDARIATLNIFFKEQQFITTERNELYGSTDFLASCGGLLGLFTGFSFLSVIEILYFISLRLLYNVKRYGRHYWSGSQQLINNDKYDHNK